VNAAELKALARAVEPLSAVTATLDFSHPVAAYNGLLSRFRERVTEALNDLTLVRPHAPGLTQELFHMARELPSMRRRVEAAARVEPVSSGG
jgi:hypothetical protein